MGFSALQGHSQAPSELLTKEKIVSRLMKIFVPYHYTYDIKCLNLDSVQFNWGANHPINPTIKQMNHYVLIGEKKIGFYLVSKNDSVDDFKIYGDGLSKDVNSNNGLVNKALQKIESVFEENKGEIFEEYEEYLDYYLNCSVSPREELKKEGWTDHDDNYYSPNIEKNHNLVTEFSPFYQQSHEIGSVKKVLEERSAIDCNVYGRDNCVGYREGARYKFRVSKVSNNPIFSRGYFDCVPLIQWGESEKGNYATLSHIGVKNVKADSSLNEFFYKILKERHYALIDSLGHTNIHYLLIGGKYVENSKKADSSLIDKIEYVESVVKRIRSEGLDQILAGPNPSKRDGFKGQQSVYLIPKESKVIIQRLREKEIYNKSFNPSETHSMIEAYHKAYKRLFCGEKVLKKKYNLIWKEGNLVSK